jgi:hypothetical protein
MKTRNSIIAVLSIALLISIGSHFYTSIETKEVLVTDKESGGVEKVNLIESYNSVNSWDFLSEKNIRFLCDSLPAEKDGEIVSLEIAQNAIDEYSEKVGNDSVLAFHIGLDHMRKMVENADLYNGESGIPDSVVGYRFYKAITTRRYGRDPMNNTRDLVAVATSKFDNSGISIKSHNNVTIPFISHFRPCPRICGKK